MKKSLQLGIIILLIVVLFLVGCGSDETTGIEYLEQEPVQEEQDPEEEEEEPFNPVPVDERGDIPEAGDPPTR